MKPIRNLRFVIVAMLFLATTINYVDRQAISVAAPVISKEFGFSATDYSYIVFWFLLSYALMQVVTGALIDRLGTKRGFSVAIVGWSLANMAHAFGSSVMSFSLLRGLLGFFEAANYPAALKAIAEWFPKSERSMAVGLVNVGPGLGAVLAPPFVAWLMLRWGWREAFLVTGGLGFVWLWFWVRIYDSPATHPRLSPDEAGLIREGAGEGGAAATVPWTALLRDSRVVGLMLARFTSDGAFYFFVFWLPTYLSSVRGFDVRQIGMFAWMPFLAADLGSVAGGFLGTRLVRQGTSIDAARKAMIWTGALLASCALPAAAAPSPYVALAWISAAMFGIQVKSSALFTVPADIVPARSVALAWGLSGAAGSLGGTLFQLYIGRMVDSLGYAPVFWSVSAMHLLSAAIVMLFLPRIAMREAAA